MLKKLTDLLRRDVSEEAAGEFRQQLELYQGALLLIMKAPENA